MRGRSSKQGNCEGERMEIDNKLDKLKEEPQLSGAHIRSLVKQLTSSRTKDPINSKDHQDSSIVPDGDDKFPAQSQNLTKISETQQPQPPQQSQQHKKQVRRRLHADRPYQERLLNMAEARREIVTALKLHRATMKQTNEHQQPTPLQTQSQSLQPSPQPEQEMKSKSRRNPRIYASTTTTTTNFSNYLDNLSYQSFPYQPPQNSYSWPISAAAPPPIPENFNLTLPNQTLGLNLNLHDFNNLDTSFFQNNYNPSINHSPSSPSTSSSSSPLSVTTEKTPYLEISQAPLVTESGLINEGDLGLHHAMDEEEMAEIRSLGEQHQIEWNDALNLVTSAWWFKFLKTMEIEPEVKAEEDALHLFDQVMEFPTWLNANDSCLQQLDHHCSSDYFQDPVLPCMDMGEIEGMDGDWLA